jgi:tetratricopeptide (TPR) repeat protein
MSRGRSLWFIGLLATISLISAAMVYVIKGVRPGNPLARGLAAYKRGEWREALEQARRSLQARPSDPIALRLCARSWARMGRVPAAEAFYLRLDIRSLEAEDLFLLGSAFLRRGEVSAAQALLGKARETDPDHPETLDALTRLWSETGEMLDAVETAQRLRRQPGWEVRGAVRLGGFRHELLDSKGAAEVLTEALSRDPELQQTGRAPEEIRKLLARCLLESGKPAEARGQLHKLLESGQDPEASWLLSRALLQEDKLPEAETALSRAQPFSERNPAAGEPAPFVGSARCAECHRSQFDSQQTSRHARTLIRTADLNNLPWPDQAIQDRDHPRVRHEIRRQDGRLEIVTRVNDRAVAAVLEYALGSNHQGQSFLARDHQGQVRVHRLSRYPSEPRWDRTIDHPAFPAEESDYLGRPLSPESVRRCLHCHATNFRAVQEPDGHPEAQDLSIGCERCHGPGGNHLRAIVGHFSESAIGHPGLAPATQVVSLCGQCHDGPPNAAPDEPNFIRFQSRTFIRSRCYAESGEAFSCVTCHDPHQDVVTSAAYYESKCLQCHPSSHPSPPEHGDGANPTWSACPINPRGTCLECHMPKVRDATPRTVFTDHWIRVARAGVRRLETGTPRSW